MSNFIKCECCQGSGLTSCETCEETGKMNCPDCEGSGKSFSICPDCHEGRVPDPRAVDDDETMPCPTCHGKYKMENGTCKTCGGSGKVTCEDCEGAGKVTCEKCNGSGKFDIADLIEAVVVSDWYDPLARDKIREDELSEADIKMLEVAAEQGNGAACYILGVNESSSSGAFAEEGDAYFSKGAEAGDANALYAHARVLPCDGLDPDLWRDMMDCLARSADMGNLHALMDLAEFSAEGYPDYERVDKSDQNGLAPDFNRVLKCCEKLSAVTQHEGVNKHVVAKAKAIGKWLPKIIKGDSAAMFELGRQYLSLNKETDCSGDRLKGENYIKVAAEKGHAEAVRLLADIKKGEDLGAAVSMLDKAAKDGDKAAKEQLKALMQECMKNQSRFDALKKVADAGNVAAMRFVASMYKGGVAGKDDKTREKKVTEWYQKAAQAGDCESMLDLSIRYRDGKGCEKNVNRAFMLSVDGFARGGHKRRALRIIAEFYRCGRFAAPDYGKAIALYTRSANAGHAASMVCLGKCYVEGLGVKKDLGEAKRLFEMAVAKKSKDAEAELKKLPVDTKANKKPASGVNGTPGKGPLPGFVLEDYEKAKAGSLWTQAFEEKRQEAKKAGKPIAAASSKKRWLFILIGILFGIFGLHFLYARRKGWFFFYWLMIIANSVQTKVPSMADLLGKTPYFGLVAGLVLIGSIFFMKKDGDGNRM